MNPRLYIPTTAICILAFLCACNDDDANGRTIGLSGETIRHTTDAGSPPDAEHPDTSEDSNPPDTIDLAPLPNDFNGTWTEEAHIDCSTATEQLLTPPVPIREFILQDGTFRVTWYPFETYVDYWGDVFYDPQTTDIVFVVTGGNYIPSDLDLEGRLETYIGGINRLILRDMWLGQGPDAPERTVECGHRFMQDF